MTKEELYSHTIQLVPVERSDSKMGFQEVLNNSFELYIGLLKEYVKSESDDYLEVDIEYINTLCSQINRIIEFQYRGLRSKAFKEFSELINGKYQVSRYLISYFGDNTPFLYRMRTFELKRGITFKDMFHIPLPKRGMASTQRYSISGYPCLYMGESAYACWEELERPDLDSCMVSRLATSLTHLIDLRIPTKKDFEKRFHNELCRFPLIIACMVQVRNQKDKFKPEYIIPQLLMEFILEENLKKIPFGIDTDEINPDPFGFVNGVRYTSVHKNEDFKFPDNKFDNVVIPVVEPLSRVDNCPTLRQLFKITNPTCDEYERIRGNNGEKSDADEERIINYEKSIFGTIENSLKDESKFPLNQMPI